MHFSCLRGMVFVIVGAGVAVCSNNSYSQNSQDAEVPNLSYPTTKTVEQVDDYHGVKVEDPFRWLEDVDSQDTKEWVKNQNELTFGYLKKIPERESLVKRLGELWNYERYGFPRCMERLGYIRTTMDCRIKTFCTRQRS